MKSYPSIGIRPIVDSRRLGIRDALEGKVREMAEAAKALIEQKILLFYFAVHPASGSTGKYNRCRFHNPSISNHSASPPVACRFAH